MEMMLWPKKSSNLPKFLQFFEKFCNFFWKFGQIFKNLIEKVNFRLFFFILNLNFDPWKILDTGLYPGLQVCFIPIFYPNFDLIFTPFIPHFFGFFIYVFNIIPSPIRTTAIKNLVDNKKKANVRTMFKLCSNYVQTML